MYHSSSISFVGQCSSRMLCAGLFLLLAAHSVQAAVTPGADIVFDASNNPRDPGKTGTDFWYPSVDTMPIHDDTTNHTPREYVWFGEGNSSITPVAVSDSSVPGITYAYSKGGSGRNRDDVTGDNIQPFIDGSNGWNEQVADAGEAPRTRSATFEVWFRNNSLMAGQQAILEWGGGNRGSYMSLVDDQLSFYVNGDTGNDNSPLVSTTLTATGWHQAVGMMHNITGDNTADDFISLYVDGALVGDTSATPQQIDDWIGGNAWGVGEIGVSNDPIGAERTNGGPITLGANDDPVGRLALDGEVAIVRYYFDQNLTAQEVLDNYNAITSAPSVPGDANGDGVVNGADFLEFQRTDPARIAEWEAAFPFPHSAVAAASAVPEPGACLLLAWGSMLCSVVRRRRVEVAAT